MNWQTQPLRFCGNWIRNLTTACVPFCPASLLCTAFASNTDSLLLPCLYPPGSRYRLGNDYHDQCYAGALEVDGRFIGGRDGNYVVFKNNGVITYQTEYRGTPVVEWRVRQTYSAKNETDDNENDFPTEDNQITIRAYCEWEDMPFTHDSDGKAVVNSAGTMFNPPAVRRRKIPIYSITRKENLNPLGTMLGYANSVNGGDYLGMPSETILMESILPEFDGKRWSVTYNMKERIEGWNTYLLDTSYCERLPNGMLVPIFDDLCVPISEPAKLNGLGRVLPNQAGIGAFVGPFKKYPQRPFGMLRLPNPFAVDSLRNAY